MFRLVGVLERIGLVDHADFLGFSEWFDLEFFGKFDYFLCFANSLLFRLQSVLIFFVLILEILNFLFGIHEHIFGQGRVCHP